MFTKRKIILVVLVCLALAVWAGLSGVPAQDKYPLAAEEKLLEKCRVDSVRTEIFTQLGGRYYKKTFIEKEGGPKLESSVELTFHPTGLKLSSTQTDRALSRALEQKLFAAGYTLDNLPPALDYSDSPSLPPVYDQNGLSCTACSIGYYLRTYQQAVEIGWQVREGQQRIDSHVFSPSFIFNQINGGINQPVPIEDACNIVQQQGAAVLSDFPDIPGDFSTQPSAEVKAKAAPHRIREWRVLYSDTDTADFQIQKTKEYLNTGDLMVAGSRTGSKFQGPTAMPDGTRIVTTEENAPYGHAYVIVGYDDDLQTPEGRGAFKIINSWGENWGNGGFGYITYPAFTKNVMVGLVFTDMVNQPDRVENLPVSVRDGVDFNINFLGTGRYDMEIRDADNNLVLRADDYLAKPGDNGNEWTGTDFAGQPVPPGRYKLRIIPYKDGFPQPPYNLDFMKQSRVSEVSTQASILFDTIQNVVVSLRPLTDGLVTVQVDEGGSTGIMAENLPLEQGVGFSYIISRKQFDFNQVDLSQVKIQIDIR